MLHIAEHECLERADIVFIVDSSGSICDLQPGGCEHWDFMGSFLVNIIENLNIGEDETRVGLVRYAYQAESIFFLNDYFDQQSLINAVESVQYEMGGTNTSGGLREMHFNQFVSNRGDRDDVHNIAVVLTDGVSTEDHDRTISDAVAARKDGIRIVTFGVTDEVSETELKLMSSKPQKLGTSYFMAADFTDFDQFTEDITKTICTEPPGIYCLFVACD